MRPLLVETLHGVLRNFDFIKEREALLFFLGDLGLGDLFALPALVKAFRERPYIPLPVFKRIGAV